MPDGDCLWTPWWHFDEFQDGYADIIYTIVVTSGEVFGYWFVLEAFGDTSKVTYEPIFESE